MFQFNEKKSKSIIEILNGTEKEVLSNLDILAKDYLEKKGKRLNKGCPSCINEMLLTLKNLYNMTQFKFKRHAASYKNAKGDKTTISNATMTDEKAVEFLSTNPERIKLFSEFPSNWETLIIDGIGSESEEDKEARLAAEAEAKAVKEAKSEKVVVLKAKPVKADLLKMKLKELRKAYPSVKATSIKEFVKEVLELPVEEPAKAETKEAEKAAEVPEENVEDAEAAAIAEAEKAAEEAAK